MGSPRYATLANMAVEFITEKSLITARFRSRSTGVMRTPSESLTKQKFEAFI